MRNLLRRWFRKPPPLLDQGGVILLYHRVATPPRDPLLLSVSPTNFADQLKALRAAARIVSLSELLSDPQPHTVAITFDDGYADNYHQALPILAAHQAPATFYIASGATDTDTEFWWDDLAELLLGNHPLPVAFQLGSVAPYRQLWLGDAEPGGCDADWTVLKRHDTHPRHRTFRTLFRMLKEFPSRERDELLDDLHAQAGLPRFRRSANRALTTAELQALAASPNIQIGAHTVTHPRLASLAPDRQRAELAASRSRLAEALGCHIAGVAYPYGGAGDFNEDTMCLVRELGFTHACANIPGAVTPATSPWRLPRFHVQDWTGAQLIESLQLFSSP